MAERLDGLRCRSTKILEDRKFSSRNFGAQSSPSPTLKIFVVPGPCRGLGHATSASPASWISDLQVYFCFFAPAS